VGVDVGDVLGEIGDLDHGDPGPAEGLHTLAVGDQQRRFAPGDDDTGDAGGEHELGAGPGVGAALGARFQRTVQGRPGQAGVGDVECGEGGLFSVEVRVTALP
jgi:hypothetical protein